MYFDDFTVGQKFFSRERRIDEKDVKEFAELTGDFNKLHMQPDFAKSVGYEGTIAHGILTLAIALGLWYSLDLTNGTTVAFAGINGVSFKAPVYPSDYLSLEAEVVAARESKSRRELGLLTVRMTLKKNDKPVLEAEPVLMILKRPK